MLMADATKKTGSRLTFFTSSTVSTPMRGRRVASPTPSPIIGEGMWWMKSVIQRPSPSAKRAIDLHSIAVILPIFCTSSCRNAAPPGSASRSGGYIHSTSRQAMKIVRMSHGR